ncbi:hypothetical protein [Clostridium sp. 1001271B_151109_B4]|uniref:hypothetical protein n=1 Tax=Clostridium sp. 1001271B_151109_B4 TaxID=2787148 RepID=UPI0018AC7B1E|nr:hypothetical protein [Clostridium sp. 1001271B_151109_B4]
MKKIVVFILMLFSISGVGCSSSNISSKDINEMKEIVDKVLSYEKAYDDEVSNYIDEDTFNECNYEVFYSYLIGEVEFTKYESEVKGVTKEDGEYNLCMVLNMEAQGATLESDGVEEGYDSVEGNDVPIEVVIKKEKGNYVIKSVKEYESLEIAENENENFREN